MVFQLSGMVCLMIKLNHNLPLVSLVVMGALECVVTLHKRCVRVRTLQATVLHARLVMIAILSMVVLGVALVQG